MSPFPTPGQGGGFTPPPTTDTGDGTGAKFVGRVVQSASELPEPGKPAPAIVAPAKGPTGVEAGVPVVLVTTSFWQSKTIKTLRAIVISAFSAFAIYVAGEIVSKGGIFMMDWSGTLHAAINLGVVTAAAAIAAWLKSNDNNPIR